MFQFKNIGLETDLVVLIVAVLSVVLLILCIVLLAKNSKLNRRYESFMAGVDGKSLEQSFLRKFENVDYINDKLLQMDNHMNDIDHNMLRSFQKAAVVKYDAFKQVGGAMSFAFALLDQENNGIILNSMHSNSDGCYIYIKEVKEGEVFVELSDEELQALEEAKRL